MRVSEIRVNQIRVNQGLGVELNSCKNLEAPVLMSLIICSGSLGTSTDVKTKIGKVS